MRVKRLLFFATLGSLLELIFSELLAGRYVYNNDNENFSEQVNFSAYHTPSETRKYIYLKYIFANLFKRHLNNTGQDLVAFDYLFHSSHAIKVLNHLTHKKTI